MKSRHLRPTLMHGAGMGANLDVITLTGYHGTSRRGLWGEVYAGRGYPSFNGLKRKRNKGKCVSWRPVGKGCKCKPQCVSYSSRVKGSSKSKALASCEAKCSSTTKRPKRRGRK